jgi:PleD family two-component response regulator
MSFGIAGWRPGQTATVDEVLKRADAALYEAKEAGRNRVGVADDAPS